MKMRRWTAGFTLIEIVLALAIAGLLLIVVFFAVSGAQKSRRDYQRKQDAATLVGLVEQWRGNHRGDNLDSQADLDDVGTNYLKRKDPKTGNDYVLFYFDAGVAHASVLPPPIGQLTYVVEHVCGTDSGAPTLVTDDAATVHGIRQFAVVYSLESGGTYCADNR